jgi:hypothetical protein
VQTLTASVITFRRVNVQILTASAGQLCVRLLSDVGC